MIKEIPDRWQTIIDIGYEIAPFGAEYEEFRTMLQETRDWSRADYEAHQLERLQDLVEHCYQNVPYYTELFDREGIDPAITSFEDFREIPILTKEQVANNPDKFISEDFGQYLPEYFTSSGTTGEELEFYLGRKAWDIEKAAIWRHFNAAGYTYGEPGIMFYPFDPEMNQDHVYNSFLCWHMLNAKVISEEMVDTWHQVISDVEPSCVQGYPSVLYRIASIFDEHDISIEIPTILTTSEPVDEKQREQIERVFGGELYDWYGLSEHTVAAYQCEEKNYHINEEYAYVEFVDQGSHSKIVGTNLYNYAMPLLRYDSGDYGSQKEGTCACGRRSQMMESVVGREREIIKTPAGEYILRHSFFLRNEPEVKRFQMIQRSPDTLDVYLVPEEILSEDTVSTINRKLNKFLNESVEIEMNVVEALPRNDSEKRRYFISEVDWDDV